MNKSEQALRCLISLLEEDIRYALDESEHISCSRVQSIIKHVVEDFEGAFTPNQGYNATWVPDE